MSPPGDIRALAWRHGPLALCGAVLVWHSLQYNFITDDAYISFTYARNLAEHGELVFNLGDPVEGYTNFLWTALLALLMVIGLPPEITSLVLGTGFALATLVVAFRLVDVLLAPDGEAESRPGVPESLWPESLWPALAPAVLSLSAGFACWASGGLETQMFTFLCALALYAYVRGDRDGRWLRRLGVILAACAMTRPEGLLCAGVIGLHRLGKNLIGQRRLRPSRDEMACLGYFALLWAPWFAWRWWYYGYPLPNTYYVKAGGEPPPGYSARLLSNGLYYVWQWARQSGAIYASPILVAAVAAPQVPARARSFGLLAAILALAYLGYTVRVGGDFMGLHRFVMPVFFLAAVLLALGLHGLLAPLGKGRLAGAVTAALCLAVVGGHGAGQIALTAESLRWGNWQSDRGIDTPAFLRIYALDRAAIGAHMRPCMRESDFSIFGGAGAKPYMGRMRGVDVFGLVSAKIAHQVPPTRPRAGHNKWAPDRLLLAMKPDFVFSCYAIHRDATRPGFNYSPSFWQRHGYEKVTLHIPALKQQGSYYSFFKRKGRAFDCPGLVE